MATKKSTTAAVAQETAITLQKRGITVTRLNLLLGTSRNPVRIDVHCDDLQKLERTCVVVNQQVVRVDVYRLVPSLATKGVFVPSHELRSFPTLDAFFATKKV